LPKAWQVAFPGFEGCLPKDLTIRIFNPHLFRLYFDPLEILERQIAEFQAACLAQPLEQHEETGGNDLIPT